MLFPVEYSQLELRVLAELQKEATMFVFFQNWQVPEEEMCLVYSENERSFSAVQAANVPMGQRAWRQADSLDLGERVKPVVDPMAGEQLKEDGKERIWNSLAPDVQQAALHAVYQAALLKERITSDDVYLAGFTPPKGKESMMGALMSKAASRGWLQDTDERRKSNRPTGRSREIHVWVSRVYQKN